jgi:hypothetical protein
LAQGAGDGWHEVVGVNVHRRRGLPKFLAVPVDAFDAVPARDDGAMFVEGGDAVPLEVCGAGESWAKRREPATSVGVRYRVG